MLILHAAVHFKGSSSQLSVVQAEVADSDFRPQTLVLNPTKIERLALKEQACSL